MSIICSPPISILRRWPPNILCSRRTTTESEILHLKLKSSVSQSSGKSCFGYSYSGSKLGFCLRASNGEKELEDEEKGLELRGESTMPDRFSYLTKQVPSPPLRWPWLLAQKYLMETNDFTRFVSTYLNVEATVVASNWKAADV